MLSVLAGEPAPPEYAHTAWCHMPARGVKVVPTGAVKAPAFQGLSQLKWPPAPHVAWAPNETKADWHAADGLGPHCMSGFSEFAAGVTA